MSRARVRSLQAYARRRAGAFDVPPRAYSPMPATISRLDITFMTGFTPTARQSTGCQHAASLDIERSGVHTRRYAHGRDYFRQEFWVV